MGSVKKGSCCHTILLVFAVLVSVITVVLVAILFGVVRSQKNNNVIPPPTTIPLVLTTSTDKTSTSITVVPKDLLGSINSTQLMFHLKQLQAIADHNNSTRAFNTAGFEATLDYIETQLRSKTNFQIFHQEFFVPVQVPQNPILTSFIGGIAKNYTYQTDFEEIVRSKPGNFLRPVRLTEIPSFGCDDHDWQRATPHPATDSVALVMRSENCSVAKMSIVAQRYNISGLLVYDCNINATVLPSVAVDRNTTYPSMILSYELGARLIEAARNYLSMNASVRMIIASGNSITVLKPSRNLCADTLSGEKTQTIIIGSHSDSVVFGPGINDNGSGTMATLVLALNLAHLFQTSIYEKYLYRIRFCWWGVEENGKLGSYHHVKEANVTTIEGNRLADYALVLNFDMLASPNYYFGIYEFDSLTDVVSPVVKDRSRKISQVFRNWFDKEKLPWDNTSFFIGSDHYPFLSAGVPASGIFSGADGVKTLEQRNRYDRMLGHGYGGIAGADYDSCYHAACDTIENTSPFAYETMVKEAAYALETIARISDLSLWLNTSL